MPRKSLWDGRLNVAQTRGKDCTDARQSPVGDIVPMSASTASDDTFDIRQAMAAHYAQMSPEAKLRRVRELTLAVSRLAMAGLRTRHPGESEGELLLRLARIRLGDDLVNAAYPGDAR